MWENLSTCWKYPAFYLEPLLPENNRLDRQKHGHRSSRLLQTGEGNPAFLLPAPEVREFCAPAQPLRLQEAKISRAAEVHPPPPPVRQQVRICPFRLSEITSCKNAKPSSLAGNGKGDLLIEKSLSETGPSPQTNH